MCDQLRLRLDHVGELLLEDLGNPAMELLAFSSQQARVRRILHERVLEHVRGVRRLTADEDKFGRRELCQGTMQHAFGGRSHAGEQAI